MLFYPYGQRIREVCDPELLSREYQNANRLAQQTTHYQWADNTIEFVSDIVTVSHDQTYVTLQGTGAALIDLLSGGADGDLWPVPLNRGLSDVDDMEKAWTSTYPELVIIIADYQYIRPIFDGTAENDAWDHDETGDRTLRFQLGIEVDGVVYPGTGPIAKAQDGKQRGTGYAQSDLRTYSMCVTLLPAGRHVVKVKAGLGPTTYMGEESSAPAISFLTGTAGSLEGGAAIASRRLFVFRNANGLLLGA